MKMHEHKKSHQLHRLERNLAANINDKLIMNLRDISHTMRSLYEGRGSQKRILIILTVEMKKCKRL